MKKIAAVLVARLYALPSVEAADPISPALFDAVLSNIYSNPGLAVPDMSGVEFKSSPSKSGRLARLTTSSESSSGLVVIAYHNNIANTLHPSFPEIVNDNFMEGALTAILLHEVYHYCLHPDSGEYSMMPMPYEARLSCEHLAIASAVNLASCAVANKLKQVEEDPGSTLEEKQAAYEKRFGVCAAIQHDLDQWNATGEAATANACLDGSSYFEFIPDEDCSDIQLPTPPNGAATFEDGEVLPECSDCDEFEGAY